MGVLFQVSGDLTEIREKYTDDTTPAFSPHESVVRGARMFRSSDSNQEEPRVKDRRLSVTANKNFKASKPVKLEANGLPKNNKNAYRKASVMTRAANVHNVLKPSGSSEKYSSNLDVSSLLRVAVKRGRDITSKKERNSVDGNYQGTRANDAGKILKMAVLRNGINRDPSLYSKISPRIMGDSAAAYGQRLGLAIPRFRVRVPLWPLVLAGLVSR